MESYFEGKKNTNRFSARLHLIYVDTDIREPIKIRLRVLLHKEILLSNTFNIRDPSAEDSFHGDKHRLDFFVFLPDLRCDSVIEFTVVESGSEKKSSAAIGKAVKMCEIGEKGHFFSMFPQWVDLDVSSSSNFCRLKVGCMEINRVLLESKECRKYVEIVCGDEVWTRKDLKKLKYSKKKIKSEVGEWKKYLDKNETFFFDQPGVQIALSVVEKLFLISGMEFQLFKTEDEEEESSLKKSNIFSSLKGSLRGSIIKKKKVDLFTKTYQTVCELMELSPEMTEFVVYQCFVTNLKLSADFIVEMLHFLSNLQYLDDTRKIIDHIVNGMKLNLRAKLRNRVKKNKKLSDRQQLNNIIRTLFEDVQDFLVDLINLECIELNGGAKSKNYTSYGIWVADYTRVIQKLHYVSDNFSKDTYEGVRSIFRRKALKELKEIDKENSFKWQMKNCTLERLHALLKDMRKVINGFDEYFPKGKKRRRKKKKRKKREDEEEEEEGESDEEESEEEEEEEGEKEKNYYVLFMHAIRKCITELASCKLKEGIKAMESKKNFSLMKTKSQLLVTNSFFDFFQSLFNEIKFVRKLDKVLLSEGEECLERVYLEEVVNSPLLNYYEYVEENTLKDRKRSLINKVRQLSNINGIIELYLKYHNEFYERLYEFYELPTPKKVEFEKTIRSCSFAKFKVECQEQQGLFSIAAYRTFFSSLFKKREDVFIAFREDFLNGRFEIAEKMKTLFDSSGHQKEMFQVDLVRDISIIKKNVNREVSGKILLDLYTTVMYELIKVVNEDQENVVMEKVKSFQKQLLETFKSSGLKVEVLEEKSKMFEITLKGMKSTIVSSSTPSSSSKAKKEEKKKEKVEEKGGENKPPPRGKHKKGFSISGLFKKKKKKKKEKKKEPKKKKKDVKKLLQSKVPWYETEVKKWSTLDVQSWLNVLPFSSEDIKQKVASVFLSMRVSGKELMQIKKEKGNLFLDPKTIGERDVKMLQKEIEGLKETIDIKAYL